MTKQAVSRAAALLGSRRSSRKTAASRRNGRLGGRPRAYARVTWRVDPVASGIAKSVTEARAKINHALTQYADDARIAHYTIIEDDDTVRDRVVVWQADDAQ